MDRYRIIAMIGAAAMAVAACSSAAAPEAGSSALARSPLPPVTAALPHLIASTTTAPVDPRSADRLAQDELRSVLAAAQQWFSESGTFDDGLSSVEALAERITVVPLQEAAGRDGVAYDAHDRRLTLHRKSASGTWFCIDVRDGTIDHGLGDSFQQALATCTDGVVVGGWGDSFSPTGPDEAAVTGVVRALFNALAVGSVEAAHELFLSESACTATRFGELWPDGLALTDSAGYELLGITVTGDSAIASFSSPPLADSPWPFESREATWLLAVDPCDLLGPLAGERMDAAALALLEQGLLAARGAFVERLDFAFAASVLAGSDALLTLVPETDVEFGTLSYSGTVSEGLLITTGSPERFYCAVESLSASTVYGEGTSVSDVDSPARCRGRATR